MIEWTDATWNPVTGCDRVSEGCKHCYALRLAERFRGTPGHPYEQGFDLRLWPQRLEQPLRWCQPRTIFVNSISDLFHEDIAESYIQQVFAVMQEASHHRFQILTKRHQRLQALAPRLPWPANVWMSVAVENRRWLPRIQALQSTQAAIKFLSCEPLLGPLASFDLDGIDWVIVGGESGPKARPMQEAWALSIRDQCHKVQISFFSSSGGNLMPRAKDGAKRDLVGYWMDVSGMTCPWC